MMKRLLMIENKHIQAFSLFRYSDALLFAFGEVSRVLQVYPPLCCSKGVVDYKRQISKMSLEMDINVMILKMVVTMIFTSSPCLQERECVNDNIIVSNQ